MDKKVSRLESFVLKYGKVLGPAVFASMMQAIRSGRLGKEAQEKERERHRLFVANLPRPV